MVVTFAFLGAAFYYTYRPKKAATSAGHACCGPEATEVEDCCATASKGRFNIMTLNKAMLWAVTVLAVAFLFFPSYVGAFLGRDDGETVTPSMNRAALTVEGMTCEGCATLVEKAIRGVPGVLAIEVDYQKGQAVVGTEACCSVPRDAILAALEKAGYRGSFSEPGAGVRSSPD
jgi:copper chaperone CopZ